MEGRMGSCHVICSRSHFNESAEGIRHPSAHRNVLFATHEQRRIMVVKHQRHPQPPQPPSEPLDLCRNFMDSAAQGPPLSSGQRPAASSAGHGRARCRSGGASLQRVAGTHRRAYRRPGRLLAEIGHYLRSPWAQGAYMYPVAQWRPFFLFVWKGSPLNSTKQRMIPVFPHGQGVSQ